MPEMTTLTLEEAEEVLKRAENGPVSAREYIPAHETVKAARDGQAHPDPELVLIDLDLIDPNPWQPRTLIDQDEIIDLAKNIDTIGLLQEPLLRPSPDGERFQSAFGHRRIAGVRLLRTQGKWGDQVLAKLADLTDEQMAYMALAENNKRSDITPLETIEAWQKALQIPGVTMTELATHVGIDRTTMSKDLLVLHLPTDALALIHNGEMKVRAARELESALRTDGHIHNDMIKAVLYDCGSEPKYGGGPPVDYRTRSVRASIQGLTEDRPKRSWNYSLDHPDRKWRPLDQVGSRDVRFDVEAFKKEFPDDVHILPKGEMSGGMEWTCNVKEWQRRQRAASLERSQAAKEGRVPASGTKREESKDEAWLRLVKADPLVASVLGVGRARKLSDPSKDLAPQHLEALGSRVLRLVDKGARIALPAAAHPQMPKNAPVMVRFGDVPPHFDFAECQTCPKAGWMQPPGYGYSDLFQLYCTDAKRYNDKKSVAMASFYEHRDGSAERDDREDLLIVKELTERLSTDLSRPIARSMLGWLVLAEVMEPFKGAERGRRGYSSCCYYPKVAEYFAAAIKAKLPPATAQEWDRQQEWKGAVTQYMNDPPLDAPWPHLAGYALVWRARLAHGMGVVMGKAE